MFKMKPRPKPIYCKVCGKKLVPNTTISGYNEFTGEPIKPWLWNMVCPDRWCGVDGSWEGGL